MISMDDKFRSLSSECISSNQSVTCGTANHQLGREPQQQCDQSS